MSPDDNDTQAGTDESANATENYMRSMAAPPSSGPQNFTDANLPGIGGGGGGGGMPGFGFDQKAYDAINQASEASSKQAEEDLKRGQGITNQMVGVIDAGLKDQQSVPVPQLGKVAEAPKFTGEAVQGWIGAITALAALAGAGARGNATTALTAFAGGMKGLMQGNQQGFKNNLETWEASTKKLLADNQAKLDQYDLIMKNKKMGVDARLSALKLQAAQNEDNMMYHLAEGKRTMEIASLLDKNQQMQLQAMTRTAFLRNTLEAGQRRQQDFEANKEGGEAAAKLVAEGKLPPNYRPSAAQQKWFNQALEKSGFDDTKASLEYLKAQTQVRGLNSNNMNKYAGAAVGVINSIDELKKLSKELNLNGINFVNQFEMEALAKKGGNDPKTLAAARYLAAAAHVKEEMALVSSAGNAPTDAAWKQAEAMLNGNYAPAALEASLDEDKKLMNYRLTAIPGFRSQLGPYGANRYTGQTGNEEGGIAGYKPPEDQGGGEMGLDDAMKFLGF